MARLLRRFFPFSSVGGAAWFAVRHREPLRDWGTWTVRSVPRLVAGEGRDLVTEAKLRARLRGDETTAGAAGDIDVVVEDGRAVLRGLVERPVRARATELAFATDGVDDVRDGLAVRSDGRFRRRR